MLAYIFVLFAVAVRLLIPYMQAHPWHFTPVAACLLFFGARGSRRQFWIPVALLAASDIVLNKFVYHYPFTPDQLVSWAWYAAVLFLGTRLRDNSKPVWIISCALASSVAFFLLSNFLRVGLLEHVSEELQRPHRLLRDGFAFLPAASARRRSFYLRDVLRARTPEADGRFT